MYEHIIDILRSECEKEGISLYQDFILFLKVKYKDDDNYTMLREVCCIDLEDNIYYFNDWYEGQDCIELCGFTPVDQILSIFPYICLK